MTTDDAALSHAVTTRTAEQTAGRSGDGFLRAFESLTNRNFRVLWTGMLFSFTGMQIGQVARQWLVYELTGSSTALGITGALTSLPALLLSLPGGVVESGAGGSGPGTQSAAVGSRNGPAAVAALGRLSGADQR